MLIGWLLTAAVLPVSGQGPELPFPLRSSGVLPEVELLPDLRRIEALHALSRVRLTDVTLPDASLVTVTLDRVQLPIHPDALHIDGRSTGLDLNAELSLWSGQVVGQADSNVFLAFSAHGSWGWVRRGGQLDHLLTLFDGNGLGDRSVWMTDERARERLAPRPLACGSAAIAPPAQAPAAPRTAASGSGRPILGVRLALETDWQYFQVFNNELATAAYTLAVLGAANSRYREQVDAVLTVEYLGIHTNPADPWTQPDIGGDCYAYLAEFQSVWGGGGAPVTADIYHLFTATDTQCAIASGQLCDAVGAWSLTGRMNGQTPFPVSPGPLNWDFVWFCHETGHNFGSAHTHAYCPPLDECPPASLWGPCQNQRVCITNGTFMSYCHSCPGGLANYTTYFHPVVADVLRATAERGCLLLFEGVLTSDLGEALAGSNGQPELEVGYNAGPNALVFDLSSGPAQQAGAWITSTNTVYQPFLGGILVPDLSVLIPLTTNLLGQASLSFPINLSFPGGVTAFTQAWIRDPSGPQRFAASNAVEWELIRP